MTLAVQNIGNNATDNDHLSSDLLFRFEAELNLLPIGLTPEGLRMANSYIGTVTRGRFLGAEVRGTDNLVLRDDGVCVIDAQTILSHPEAGHVFEHVHGYCLPPEGVEIPELSELVDPAFQWPDVDFPIVAFSTFRSGAPDFAYLNRAMARIDGWANFATGGLAVDTNLVRHNDRVAAPVRRNDSDR
jgi:hypothetical protein